LALVLVVLAGIGLSGIGGAHATHPAQWALGALLVGAGLVVLLRRPFSFHVALGVALLVAVSGCVAWLGHPELALPVPPVLSIVLGLYLCLRTVLARPGLSQRVRRPLFDEEPESGA
jgi:hypothetical protein